MTWLIISLHAVTLAQQYSLGTELMLWTCAVYSMKHVNIFIFVFIKWLDCGGLIFNEKWQVFLTIFANYLLKPPNVKYLINRNTGIHVFQWIHCTRFSCQGFSLGLSTLSLVLYFLLVIVQSRFFFSALSMSKFAHSYDSMICQYQW